MGNHGKPWALKDQTQIDPSDQPLGEWEIHSSHGTHGTQHGMTWPDSGGEVAISGRNLVHSLGKTATKNGPLGFRAIAGFIYGVGEFLQFFGLRRQTSYWKRGVLCN